MVKANGRCVRPMRASNPLSRRMLRCRAPRAAILGAARRAGAQFDTPLERRALMKPPIAAPRAAAPLDRPLRS
jgi:hypothetical protein